MKVKGLRPAEFNPRKNQREAFADARGKHARLRRPFKIRLQRENRSPDRRTSENQASSLGMEDPSRGSRSPEIDRVPKIPTLYENNVKWFFDYYADQALYDVFPDYRKSVLAFGSFSGWRAMEIPNPRWNRVDFVQGRPGLPQGKRRIKKDRKYILTQTFWAS